MKTKKEIVKFLEELAIGVQGKRDDYDKKIGEYRSRAFEGGKTPTESQHIMDMLGYFTDQYNYTEGQLYEINYILSEITRDARKK